MGEPTKIVKLTKRTNAPIMAPDSEKETWPGMEVDYPIVVQRYKPTGVEIEIFGHLKLNPRKLETGLMRSFQTLRLLRLEEVRAHDAAAQVAPDSTDEVRPTEDKEPSWQQEKQELVTPENLALAEMEKAAIQEIKAHSPDSKSLSTE